MLNLTVTQSPTVHLVWTQSAGPQLETFTASSSSPCDLRTLGLLDMEKPPTWMERLVENFLKYFLTCSSPEMKKSNH